jgi:L-threonylcarbamoyladenylate synthase
MVKRSLILKAAEIIKKGGLVGFPTETVYGIAADPKNKKAITRLDEIKNRPKGKPYTFHIAYKKDIYKLAYDISPLAKKIIKKYLPGPLTLLLKDSKGGKIGFRMPDNKTALSFIRAVGRPVVAPSANKSGMPSPVRAEDVCDGLDFVLDDGPTKYRKDSTIIDLSIIPPQIIRQGYLKIKLK